MAKTVPKGVLISPVKYGITHFLRIPLATTESVPRLLSSLEQAAQDPIASALHRAAWSVPDQLHFVIGRLSLKTPERIETAIRLLNEFRKADLLHLKQPPIVSLEGLVPSEQAAKYPKETKTLACRIIEAKSFLEEFRSLLLKAFIAEGFVPAVRRHEDPTDHKLAKIMDTDVLRTTILKTKPWATQKRWPRAPVFNASDFHPKYESYSWAQDFPLEKLCISELGLKVVTRKGICIKTAFPNVACVPLPGVSADKVTWGHPDDEYQKAAKMYQNRAPVTPLLIPFDAEFVTTRDPDPRRLCVGSKGLRFCSSNILDAGKLHRRYNTKSERILYGCGSYIHY